MCAKKTINLKRTELQFLRKKISEKYAQDEGTDLNLNSNRDSYAALKRGIRYNLKGKVEFYISEYLLFKLFYETKHSSEASFNLDFINTLYLYLTEGRKNRIHYFNFSSDLNFPDNNKSEIELIKQFENSRRQISRTKNNPFLKSIGFRLSLFRNNYTYPFFFLCLFVFMFLLFTNSFDGFIPSKKMHCTYWVCKYEDGTKVWSRFEGNATYIEATNFFKGNVKRNKMNCEAFRMENNSRISICYDNLLAKQYISEFGNIKCVYRE